jgi:hypothetical protein
MTCQIGLPPQVAHHLHQTLDETSPGLGFLKRAFGSRSAFQAPPRPI